MTGRQDMRSGGAAPDIDAPPPRVVAGRGGRFLRIYVAALVLAALAFAVLAALVHAREGSLMRLDVRLELAVQGVHWSPYGWLLTHVSDLGYRPLNVIAYAVVFVALCAARRYRAAVLAVGASLLADLVGSALRQLVGRPRPTAELVHVARHIAGYGFPSGHVIQYVTLFGFACYVVLVTWRGGLPRAVVAALLTALVALVGPSRAYLGAHWPSDTLGAYLFAGVWLAATIEVHLALERRRAARSGAGDGAAHGARG